MIKNVNIFKILFSLMALFIGGIANAQDFAPVMDCEVYRHTSGSSIILNKGKSHEGGGTYETITVLIIQNTPVIMMQRGEADEWGFVDEEKESRIYFQLSDLKSNFTGHEWIWKGKATMRGDQDKLPMDFSLTLGESDDVKIVIGRSIHFCNKVRNYDFSLINKYMTKDDGTQSSSRPQNPSQHRSTSKPPLRK